MERIYKSGEINHKISSFIENGETTGLVPTMGALHEGHIALIKKAKSQNDKVICSIFVNPLQFNRAEDLESYPDRMKEDVEMLEKAGCDIVFTPDNNDLYRDKPDLNLEFGQLGKVMEAVKRPGHFEGVAAVIERLFSIVRPTRAYFGEKDYQQLAIIRCLVAQENMNVKIVPCRTVRNSSGLALSSRNYLLSREELKTASFIYDTLHYCKQNKDKYTPRQLAEYCKDELQKEFYPEYFEIVDETTFLPIEQWRESTSPRAFVAAYLSGVRLIDNMSLIN